MKKITIILPVYKLDVDDISMLENALRSTDKFHEDVNILIVCPDTLKKQIKDIEIIKTYNVKMFYNTTKNTDFISQINLGIENCDTEWFSILEIDDEYKETWFKTINEYLETYLETEVFLPIIEDVNQDGNFVGFTNESLWALGFTAKQGFLDKDILLEYQNFQTSGGLYKTDVIKENGSFKDNIKLTFSYEFLLRLTNNGVIVMGVPKLGYRHVNFRENSLFWMYKNDESLKLSDNDVVFWLNTAKKEYFFKNKRDIDYVKS